MLQLKHARCYACIMESNRYALLVLVIAAALTLSQVGHSRAEPTPALDRQLVERLVRAQEAQVRQLEALTRAVEKLKH